MCGFKFETRYIYTYAQHNYLVDSIITFGIHIVVLGQKLSSSEYLMFCLFCLTAR